MEETKSVASEKPKPRPRPNRAPTAGRGLRGRGGGRGRGRGRANLPSGRVAFVGAKSAGSIQSSSSIKKDKVSNAAAAGGGINFSDMKDSAALDMNKSSVWPPELESEYQPITLPFGKPRPILYSNGEKAIFCDGSGNSILDNDALLFIQFPTRLPTETSDLQCNGFGGKIQVHQSGRTTLRLGETEFQVNSGLSPSFSQQAVDITDKEVCILGSIANQLVITPNFDSILATESKTP